MTLSRLAIKNLKKQSSYYLMYFMCMMFSVIVYYSFVSMSFDKRLLSVASKDIRIDVGLRAGSAIIILFIIVFMFSANTFFIKRRKREIGLYSLLGMRRRQISGLLFIENTILGTMALVIGISLGIILSRLFAMILLKFMHISVASHFIVNFAAIKNTIFVFFIILLIVSIRTATTVYRFKLITLFKAEQQGEGQIIAKWYNWVLGFLGILLLTIGYYLADHFFMFGLWISQHVKGDDIFLVDGPIIILCLCIVGTYLIFTHFLIVMLKVVSVSKRYYYRDIHMVTNGNLRFNLKRNGRTLATIAILSGTALASIGGAASFQSHILRWEDYSNPTSYAVDDKHYEKLIRFLKKKGMTVSKEATLNFKLVGGEFYYQENFNQQDDERMCNVISLSNYNDVKMVIRNVPNVTLKNQKDVAILGNTTPSNKDKIISYNKNGFLGNIGQVNVVAYVPDTLGNHFDMRISGNTLVVTDELYNQLKSAYSYSYHLIDIDGSDENETLAKASISAFNQEINEVYKIKAEIIEENQLRIDSITVSDKEVPTDLSLDYYTKNTFSMRYLNYNGLKKSTGLLIYVAVFLGMIFMIATGSIIALKQLSEAEDQIKNYDLLRKLGTPEHLIKRNVYTQNKLIFFVPLLVSLMHAYFAIQVLLTLIGAQNMKLTYIAVVFLLIIYATLYFITSSTYYKIINQ